MPTKKSKTSNNNLKNQNNKTVTMSKNSDKRKKLDESNYKFDKDVLSICYGSSHAAGLKSDGTVVAMAESALRGTILDNEFGQCDVDSWRDIVAIDVGDYHTIGLKSDGTVVAVGENSRGQCDVDSWKNIVSICAGENHTVGLRSDGTVVATGANESNQCKVKTWKDIVSIGIGTDGISTVGTKSDGTLRSTSKWVNKEFSNYRLFASVKTK